jgi:hypothetical protein
MMITYRGYTLVPLMEGGKSHVSVFSRATFVTKTTTFEDEQAAVAEARKAVDSILSQRQLRSPGLGNRAISPSSVDSRRL